MVDALSYISGVANANSVFKNGEKVANVPIKKKGGKKRALTDEMQAAVHEHSRRAGDLLAC